MFPALALCLLGVPGQAGVDDQDRGFYIGFEPGLTDASALETTFSAINHPTKCDVLLYADPSLAPRDNADRPPALSRLTPDT